MQSKHGFIQLLMSRGVAVSPKVIDKICISFAARMILCVEHEDAIKLYDDVQRMPQTTILDILKEKNHIYLNGIFFSNTKTVIINALEHGKPTMFKIPKTQFEAEHEYNVWKLLSGSPNVNQEHLVPLTMVSLDKAEMLKTSIAGEVELQPVRFGLMMPKYACVTINFKGVGAPTLVKWVTETLLAIEQFHIIGLIHGDVKPDNIFLDQDGVVKLGDYGAAVEFNADFKELSPAYMPSDIPKACKEVDHYCLAMSSLELCDVYTPTNNIFLTKAEIKSKTNLLVNDLSVLFKNLLV
jgi:hypothetical protein